jgi:hypothetical protein
VIDESDSQHEKHFDPRISTFLGIKIDSSDEHENTFDSIRVKCEFDSNTIDLSGRGLFLMPTGSTCQCQFRKITEFGIQARRISESQIVQRETVLIEPPLTRIRRS